MLFYEDFELNAMTVLSKKMLLIKQIVYYTTS